MQFTLYEEFPDEKSLEKLVYINFPADIVLASQSLKEFQNLAREVRYSNSNVRRIGYWPLLKKEEGYWLSPFADKKALERKINELRAYSGEELLLIWDSEPGKPKGIRNFYNFSKNRRLIQEFLMQSNAFNLDVVSVEAPSFFIPENIQESFGLSFNPLIYGIEKNKMLYSSLNKYVPGNGFSQILYYELFKKELRKFFRKYGERFSASLGCLDSGVFNNEPKIKPDELRYDLTLLKEENISKAFIFRLGGINKEFADVIKEFPTS